MLKARTALQIAQTRGIRGRDIDDEIIGDFRCPADPLRIIGNGVYVNRGSCLD